MTGPGKRRFLPFALLLASSAVLALVTVGFHVRHLGLAYLEEGNQLERHRLALAGEAYDPWQYRVLSTYLVEGFMRAAAWMGAPRAVATAFIGFRYLQDTLLFLTAGLYYRVLGLGAYHRLLGLSILAWGMTHGIYDSDLQFSTWFDVIFYLLAAISILRGRHAWIVPLGAVAALNRETGVLIPILLAGEYLRRRATSPLRRRTLVIALSGLACFVIVLVTLRVAYGPRPGMPIPGIGLDLLRHNLLRYQTWGYLLATLGIIPALAIAAMPRWPPALRTFFWTIVPAWFAVHLAAAIAAETRLFIMPQALIFIPGALFGISGADEHGHAPASTSPVAPSSGREETPGGRMRS